MVKGRVTLIYLAAFHLSFSEAVWLVPAQCVPSH